MATLGSTTKAALGVKAVKSPLTRSAALKAIKGTPTAAKASAKVGRPILKRKARKQAGKVGDVASSLGEVIANYAPEVARQLGYELEEPKPKRTLPRVLFGVAVGAAAMYFLEPEHGAEHRQQVQKLLG